MLGETIDQLYELRTTRLAIEAQATELKKQETELRTKIIADLQEQQLGAGRGSIATASIKTNTVPHVTDWPAVYQFIQDNNMFELLHRRITSTLWAALEEEGRSVPGIDKQTVLDLSLTKAAK